MRSIDILLSIDNVASLTMLPERFQLALQQDLMAQSFALNIENICDLVRDLKRVLTALEMCGKQIVCVGVRDVLTEARIPSTLQMTILSKVGEHYHSPSMVEQAVAAVLRTKGLPDPDVYEFSSGIGSVAWKSSELTDALRGVALGMCKQVFEQTIPHADEMACSLVRPDRVRWRRLVEDLQSMLSEPERLATYDPEGIQKIPLLPPPPRKVPAETSVPSKARIEAPPLQTRWELLEVDATEASTARDAVVEEESDLPLSRWDLLEIED